MIRKLLTLMSIALAFLPARAQNAPERFVHKPLLEIMRGTQPSDTELDQLPIYFTIPSDFITFYGGDRVGVLLGTQQDINAMTKSGSIRDTKSGFFRVAVSLGTAYDSATDKFTDEGDPQLKDKLAAAGLTGCSFRRVDTNSVPMLASTCMKGERHTYLLHVAYAHPEDVTLKVFYFHPPQHTERDEQIWSRFIEGLSGKN